MDLRSILHSAKTRFRDAGLPTPELDARFLIQDILGLSDTEIILARAETTPEQQKGIEAAIERRLNGEPVSRILGYREFYGRKFYLSPATLDPRPDTETLIEAVLSHKWNNAPRVLDLGTGTGCILLTLLSEISGSSGIGVDLSPEACVTAKRNAESLGLESKALIQQGSWTDSLDEKFDIIASNPPYIPSAIIPTLSPEVQNHDPILALDGGNDGLAPYKILLPALKKFLVPGGLVFFEVGQGQAEDIKRLVGDSDATLSRTWVDLGGVERVLEIGYGDK